IRVALLREGRPQQIRVADIAGVENQAWTGEAALHIGEVVVSGCKSKISLGAKPCSEARLAAEQPFVAAWHLDRSRKSGGIESRVQIGIEDRKGAADHEWDESFSNLVLELYGEAIETDFPVPDQIGGGPERVVKPADRSRDIIDRLIFDKGAIEPERIFRKV